MFDLRQEFLTGAYVAISEDRANRPSVANDGDICPFCEKNWHMTPPTKFLSKNKRIRVVNNMFPALPAYKEDNGGFHEVVIDTSAHDDDFTYFTDEHITEVLLVIRDRVRFMSLFDKTKYVQVFKNNGLKSGASINHSHWQITGLPVIPDMQRLMYNNQRSSYFDSGCCYMCDEVRSLTKNDENSLLIYKNDYAAAYVPFTSPYYYGIKIATTEHISDYKDIGEMTAWGIANVLGVSVRALRGIFTDVSYNICILNMPYIDRNSEGNPFSHFYIQIIPRIGNFAGLELSTGCYISSAFPEQAAHNLRKRHAEDKRDKRDKREENMDA